MKNKNINDDLKNLAMENDKDFDAYIEKAINRRIKKIAARTFIVMLAAVVARDFLHKPADEADLP